MVQFASEIDRIYGAPGSCIIILQEQVLRQKQNHISASVFHRRTEADVVTGALFGTEAPVRTGPAAETGPPVGTKANEVLSPITPV